MFRSSLFKASTFSTVKTIYSPKYSTTLNASPHYGIHFIKETFKAFSQNTFLTPVVKINLELKESIVLDHCLRAEKIYQTKGSGLARFDIPLQHIKSLDEKLKYTTDSLTNEDLRPTGTSHPTHVFSDETGRILRAITIDYLALKHYKRGEKEAQIRQNRIVENIGYIVNHSMLPSTNLTPEQEIERQNESFIYMMEDWPEFEDRFVTHYSEKHAPDKKLEIKQALASVLKSLYRVRSWSVADVDGNLRRNAQTMSIMDTSLQLHIVRFYQKLVALLIERIPKIQRIQDYLKRCEASIMDNICFDTESSERAKQKVIRWLDGILVSHQLDKNTASQIAALKSYVDLIGFRGEIKQYVRQSSVANDAVFDNFAQILAKHHEEIKGLLTDKEGKLRNYTSLEMHEKETLNEYLRTHSKYFTTLKQQAHEFTAATIRELDILSFVTKHKDLFSYILSDTKNTLNLHQIAILFAVSAYLKGNLFVDQVRKPPMLLIPLCETSDDLARLVTIFQDMLDDPYLREILIEHGEFVYVPGFSDLGRESSELAHVSLIKAYVSLEKLLKRYQIEDPRLLKIKIRPLYGSGGDSQRRISKSDEQTFATLQGEEFYRLTGVGAFSAYVENRAGRSSENTLRALEFNDIEERYPNESQKLEILVAHAISAYKRYHESPVAENLFRRLTFAYLGAWFNTGSRGESKSSEPKDIIKSRAIGLVNYEALTRIAIRRIMSADGLVDLPLDIQAALPTLYEHSTVLREIVLKIISAIATSNIPRAWIKLCGKMPSTIQIRQWVDEFQDETVKEKKEHHALAYLDYRSHLILQAMTLFLPEFLRQQGSIYFENHPPLSQPSDISALALLKKMGQFHVDFKELHEEIRSDILPRYSRLEKAIDAYEEALPLADKIGKEKMALLSENVVLAFRGDAILPGGSVKIASMHASDHLFSASGIKPYHQENPQQALSSSLNFS